MKFLQFMKGLSLKDNSSGESATVLETTSAPQLSKRERLFCEYMECLMKLPLKAEDRAKIKEEIVWTQKHLWILDQSYAYLRHVRFSIAASYGTRKLRMRSKRFWKEVRQKKAGELTHHQKVVSDYKIEWEHFCATAQVYNCSSWGQLRHFLHLNQPDILFPEAALKGSLQELEKKLHAKASRYTSEGKDFILIDATWKWVILMEGRSREEGRAMRHCGNIHRNDTVMYSLREKMLIEGVTEWKPHLSFVARDGILIEMKGFANSKPQTEFHPQIVKLLLHADIKRIGHESSYLRDHDFDFFDLSEDQQETVARAKPEIIELPILSPEIKTRPWLDLGKDGVWLINSKCSENFMLNAFDSLKKFGKARVTEIYLMRSIIWGGFSLNIIAAEISYFRGNILYINEYSFFKKKPNCDAAYIQLYRDFRIKYIDTLGLRTGSYEPLRGFIDKNNTYQKGLEEVIDQYPERFHFSPANQDAVKWLMVDDSLSWCLLSSDKDKTASVLSLRLTRLIRGVLTPIAIANLIYHNRAISGLRYMQAHGSHRIKKALMAVYLDSRINRIYHSAFDTDYSKGRESESCRMFSNEDIEFIIKLRPNVIFNNNLFSKPWLIIDHEWRWNYTWRLREINDDLFFDTLLQLEKKGQSGEWLPFLAVKIHKGILGDIIGPIFNLNCLDAVHGNLWHEYVEIFVTCLQEGRACLLPHHLLDIYKNVYQSDYSRVKQHLINLIQHPSIVGVVGMARSSEYTLDILSSQPVFHWVFKESDNGNEAEDIVHSFLNKSTKHKEQWELLQKRCAVKETIDGQSLVWMFREPLSLFLNSTTDGFLRISESEHLLLAEFGTSPTLACIKTSEWAQKYIHFRRIWQRLRLYLQSFACEHGFTFVFDPQFPWSEPLSVVMPKNSLLLFCDRLLRTERREHLKRWQHWACEEERAQVLGISPQHMFPMYPRLALGELLYQFAGIEPIFNDLPKYEQNWEMEVGWTD
jgi:hypothetical protein